MHSLAVSAQAAAPGPTAAPQTMTAVLAAPFAKQLADLLGAASGASARTTAPAMPSCGLHSAGIRSDPAIQTGVTQTGALQTGALQTGALQTGALQTGALQTDALQPDAIQTGVIQTGATMPAATSGLPAATPYVRAARTASTEASGKPDRPVRTGAPLRRRSDPSADAGTTSAAGGGTWPAGIPIVSTVTPVTAAQVTAPTQTVAATPLSGGQGLAARSPLLPDAGPGSLAPQAGVAIEAGNTAGTPQTAPVVASDIPTAATSPTSPAVTNTAQAIPAATPSPLAAKPDQAATSAGAAGTTRANGQDNALPPARTAKPALPAQTASPAPPAQAMPSGAVDGNTDGTSSAATSQTGTDIPQPPAALLAAMPPPAGASTTRNGGTASKAPTDTQTTEARSPAPATAQDAPPASPSLTARTAPAFAVVAKPQATNHASPGAGNAAPAPQAAAATPFIATAASAASVQADPAAPAAEAGHAQVDPAARRADAAPPDQRRSTADTVLSTPASPALAPGINPSDAAAQASAGPGQPEAAAPASLPTVPLTPAAGSPDVATTTSAAPVVANPRSDPPTPAQQVLPALVSLGHSQGVRHVTVRLDPQELGRLQIRVEQPKDGPARVTLTAERPQTLDLLMRDQAQLHRALDQAGVPAEGRSISFHLAATHPAAITPDPVADPSRAALPTVASGGSAAPGSGDGGGAQRGPQRDSFPAGFQRKAADTIDLEDAPPRTARWLRTGIDITA